MSLGTASLCEGGSIQEKGGESSHLSMLRGWPEKIPQGQGELIQVCGVWPGVESNPDRCRHVDRLRMPATASNYELAAQLAPPDARMGYLQQASPWRQLAHELQMERFGPFGSANLFIGDARTEPGDAPGALAD